MFYSRQIMIQGQPPKVLLQLSKCHALVQERPFCYLSNTELIISLPAFVVFLYCFLTAKGHVLAEHTLLRIIFNDVRIAKCTFRSKTGLENLVLIFPS